MRIDFTIDDKKMSVNVNSNEPLSYTIMELRDKNTILQCDKKNCGRCLVLDRKKNEILLSCITPMFRLEGCDIITPEYFYSSKNSLFIRNSYKETGIIPCDNCIKEKTLLFEWLSSFFDRKNVKLNIDDDSIFFTEHESVAQRGKLMQKGGDAENNALILSLFSLVKCTCLKNDDILKLAKKVLEKGGNTNV